MEKNNNLDNFEREYYSEIRDLEVSLSELKKYGVNDKMISSELYLYNIYGDEIVTSKIIDDVDSKQKKTVSKIGDEDIDSDKGYRAICNDIEESEFDKNVEVLLTSLDN